MPCRPCTAGCASTRDFVTLLLAPQGVNNNKMDVERSTSISSLRQFYTTSLSCFLLFMDSSTSGSESVKQAHADLDACVSKYSWLFCVGGHSLAIQLCVRLTEWSGGVILCNCFAVESDDTSVCTGGVALSVPICIRIKASLKQTSKGCFLPKSQVKRA